MIVEGKRGGGGRGGGESQVFTLTTKDGEEARERERGVKTKEEEGDDSQR